MYIRADITSLNTESLGAIKAIVSNPNTRANVLERIYNAIKDRPYYQVGNILTALAGNPNTPVYILQDVCNTFEQAIDDYLRAILAANPSLPKNVRYRLCNDYNVACIVLETLNASADILTYIYDSYGRQLDTEDLAALLRHPNTPQDLKDLIAQDHFICSSIHCDFICDTDFDDGFMRIQLLSALRDAGYEPASVDISYNEMILRGGTARECDEYALDVTFHMNLSMREFTDVDGIIADVLNTFACDPYKSEHHYYEE